MGRKKKAGGNARRPATEHHRRAGGDRLGPPPAEATLADPGRDLHTGTSPVLSGGDVDADWQRAASAGEEAVGGSVPTPDQDVVDQLGDALGVPRAPDESFRPSSELLDSRDARRARQEG